MKLKTIPLAVLLIVVIFLSGCAQQGEQTTQETSESAPPKTEIVGRLKGTEMVIKPSVDNVIKGIVTVTATKVPEGAQRVYFVLSGQSIEGVGPNINIDTDGSDGWSGILDTTQYENGVYTIGALAFLTTEITEDDPIGGATAQVIIQN